MNGKIRQAIREHNMIARGDRIAVGVSGGADSVALLHVLKEAVGEFGFTLSALHLNHKLRGEDSDGDEAFVRRLCWDWHIPLTVKALPVADLARERGLGVEECARELRYDFFRRGTPSGGKTATAHTLSDNAETVLLNLVRGTALRGLCGIPPVRENDGGPCVIRPLILCTRREVEAYCAEHGLRFVTDKSNADTRFSRNRLRLEAGPVLESVNPRWQNNVAGTIESLRADAEYLDALAASALDNAGRGEGVYDRAALLALAQPLLMRALLLALRRRGLAVDRKRLLCLKAMVERGKGGMQLSGEWLCVAAADSLRLKPVIADEPEHFDPVEIPYPFKGRIIPAFSGKTLRIFALERHIFKESINNDKKQFKNALDCDRIGRIVKLRQRAPGDSIRLAGRGCTKSLKKLFQEADLSIRERSRVLVLEGGEGPLWVEGFGVAESAAVTANTQKALIVNVLEDEVCTRTSERS